MLSRGKYGDPVERPPRSKPPCFKCPKCAGFKEKSPEVGKTATLSSRNRKTLRIYYEVKATSGRTLTDEEARDPILRDNLARIEQILDSIDREQRQTALKMQAAHVRR